MAKRKKKAARGDDGPQEKTPGTRNTKSKTAERLLAIYEADRTWLDKSDTELATELKVHPASIARAKDNSKYRDRFQQLERERHAEKRTKQQM